MRIFDNLVWPKKLRFALSPGCENLGHKELFTNTLSQIPYRLGSIKTVLTRMIDQLQEMLAKHNRYTQTERETEGGWEGEREKKESRGSKRKREREEREGRKDRERGASKREKEREKRGREKEK